MSTARAEILKTIRGVLSESAPLPSHDGPWIEYPDPAAQFGKVMEMIGGACVLAPDLAAVESHLQRWQPAAEATHSVTYVNGVGRTTVDPLAPPSELQHVEFAVLPGEFAVAENAAVWVSDRVVPHRAMFFLCEHLALVVPRKALVHQMHQAYQRLDFSGAGFGAFISGPSKTADIEQSLVIGAHGPRSTIVYLVGDA